MAWNLLIHEKNPSHVKIEFSLFTTHLMDKIKGKKAFNIEVIWIFLYFT